jgi:hypothetical protein
MAAKNPGVERPAGVRDIEVAIREFSFLWR